MKLAIVDLDGVIANVDARFARAEEVKNDFLDNAVGTKREWSEVKQDATNLYWRAVFNPEYVPLDTLIDGVVEAISFIERYPTDDNGYEVIYLTSRPESMQEATCNWLYEHALSGPRLVMKPSAFQFTKTVVWKAGMVQTLSGFFHASQVLVVDDEQVNLNEIVKHALVPLYTGLPGLMIAKSLAEAVAKLNGTWVEPDPFLPEFPKED